MMRKRIPNTEFYNVLKEGPELHFYLFLKEHFTEGKTQFNGHNTRVDFTDSTGAVVATVSTFDEENTQTIHLVRKTGNEIMFLTEFEG